ncbi:MAG: TonB-dependent receptor [Flavobacteriaceae bacterium]|nr:TonB-dependent receptor [Flavobacteriaceae bacterium]|tara:strand:- start:2275 stop:4119 length:1845 start_codon:yes stop_codon:yes gene_type:complete
MKKNCAAAFLSLVSYLNPLNAQLDSPSDSLFNQKLEEVFLSSNRLETTLTQNSKTINIITADQIRKSGVTHLVDILQQIGGVDIQRRGTGPTQADLKIRGGTFDQTLLLIDGIKLDDAQTGHHTLNFLPPPQMVARIEIIKGPAARAYGQNALTGAINIVTQTETPKMLSVDLQHGSYDQTNGSLYVSDTKEKTSLIGFVSKNTSDGYRYNSDYNHNQYFVKSSFNRHKTPLHMITSFSDRKFGANGFYASPSAVDQYEETQGSLVSLSQRHQLGNWIFKPKLYWRRGQDMYEYIRNNPKIYRNLHITHKVGGALDVSLPSKLGITGVGVDISKVSIRSNNLGNRKRTMMNFFLEHRFYFFDNTLDITPGISINYFSDFGTHSFPGVDLGWQLNSNVRVYANAGATFRIPTFTDLFYSDPSTLGNANLKPEEANTKEVGIRFTKSKVTASVAYFNRKSKNLIDFVKNSDDSSVPFMAQNIQEVTTNGIDLELLHHLKFNSQLHQFKINYSYLNNSLEKSDYSFSRYSINNDLKHHITGTYNLALSQVFDTLIALKYVERNSGIVYRVVDISAQLTLRQFLLSFYFNNIFNTRYWESNLVPMPKGNGLIGVRYSL